MKKIHFAWYDENTTEGGLARNKAISQYTSSHEFKIINFYPKNILERIINIFRMTIYLLTLKNTIILLHGNFFITNYLLQILSFKWYALLLSILLKRASKMNKLIIEINDLRYEQSLDVKSKKVSLKFDTLERQILFNSEDFFYIFASGSMKDFAIKKYNLKSDKIISIINGGPQLDCSINNVQHKIDNKKINLVYAGTLNKGRQIEEMINQFVSNDNIDLYLLGIDGEWILSEYKDESNVHYLGDLVEKKAHQFVSQCDIGLIPYNNKGLYYNICYPTKASFYVTAEIPFLSTKLNELQSVFYQEKMCIFEDIDNWNSIISSLDKENIEKMKLEVKTISAKFTWSYVLEDIQSLLKYMNFESR